MNENALLFEIEAQKDVAVGFCLDLVARRYTQAHQKLAAGLATELSAAQLAVLFEEVVGPVGVGRLEIAIEAVEMVDQDVQWTWYYVPINGDNDSEALTIAVNHNAPNHLIEEIEWGRY